MVDVEAVQCNHNPLLLFNGDVFFVIYLRTTAAGKGKVATEGSTLPC